MDQLCKTRSKFSEKQTKRSFGNIVGLLRRTSDVTRPTWEKGTNHERLVYRGQRPLRVTDIHRVVDIVPQTVDEYEDPLWLVRRHHVADEERDDSVTSKTNCEDVFSERRRTLSLGAKNMPLVHAESMDTLLSFPERDGTDYVAGSKISPVAPLRIRRNQHHNTECDVTRVHSGCSTQGGLAHTQGLDRRSNTLPLNDAISPLQRMTDKINQWSSGATEEGARLRPGPAARLPVVRSAAVSPANASQNSAKSSAPSCPPFPSISHSKFDLRCSSKKPGYSRTRLYSSPCSFELGRSRMLPICQKSSRLSADKVAKGVR